MVGLQADYNLAGGLVHCMMALVGYKMVGKLGGCRMTLQMVDCMWAVLQGGCSWRKGKSCRLGAPPASCMMMGWEMEHCRTG